jgi:NADPH:quinone reductase-like Zn-dependent oxidoreductase
MRALNLYDTHSRPDSLRLVEKPVPTPGPGEVLIRVAAAPINPSDLMFLKGLYASPKKIPVVPGFEGSGVVVSAGSGVLPRFYVGRRVGFVGDDGDGTWAEYAIARALLCIPLPKNVTLEQGAMTLVNPLSALLMMDIVRQGRHKAIIQTAAASALGKMLLKLGLQRGLPIIHVVRRTEQLAALQALGAQYVLNSTDPDFDTTLKALAQQLKATLAFDAVGGELTGRVLAAMPKHSEIMIYGALAEAEVVAHPGLFIFEDKRISGFWTSERTGRIGLMRTAPLILKARGMLSSELVSTIHARYPLSAAAEALADYSANMSAGKVLFVPGKEPN